MQEVELTNHANSLLDHYKSCYRRRYGSDPFIANIGIAMTAIKDLIRGSDHKRARDILTTYIKMNGDQDWYKRQGHTLDCLVKNVAAVSAATPSIKEERSSETRMVWWTWCATPTCKAEQWQITGTLEELDYQHGRLLCAKCQVDVRSKQVLEDSDLQEGLRRDKKDSAQAYQEGTQRHTDLF